MKIAHVTSGVVRLLFVIVTAQPPLPAARPTTPRLFPVVTQKLTAPAVGGVVHAVGAEDYTEEPKYPHSAVSRLRMSDFIETMYAFAFVLANFGIAMAAKMPLMTTTISSSMSEIGRASCRERVQSTPCAEPLENEEKPYFPSGRIGKTRALNHRTSHNTRSG